MTLRPSAHRFGAALAVALLAVSCGGSDDSAANGGTAMQGEAGEAGAAGDVDDAELVLDTVDPSVTPDDQAAEDTTSTPDTTATPETAAPGTAPPGTTAPETTAPGTAAPETTAPPTTAPESTVAPDTTAAEALELRSVADDSGTLRAQVPAAWVETDGAPDGQLRQVAAAPDLTGFLDGYTLPGMLLITGPASTPEVWRDALSTTVDVAEADGCLVTDTSDYDDGLYTGSEQLLTCGDTSSVAHLIAGRDAPGDLFFLLAIVRPVADVEIRNQIVQSFFID